MAPLRTKLKAHFPPAPASLAKIPIVLARRATRADANPFRDLLGRTSKDDLQLRFFGQPHVNEAFIQAQLLAREPGAAWVVYGQGEERDRMLGHALLMPDGPNKAELAILMSAEGGRGSGLAKMLVADVQRYAVSQGFRELHAVVDRQNVPVKRLLTSSGFVPGKWAPGEDLTFHWHAPANGATPS